MIVLDWQAWLALAVAPPARASLAGKRAGPYRTMTTGVSAPPVSEARALAEMLAGVVDAGVAVIAPLHVGRGLRRRRRVE